MNDLSINGKLYAGLGDMLVTDTNVIAFNKDMANQYAIEGIYDLVYNGAWTLEELNRVINEVGYTDLNGDGMTDNDDMYGIVFNAQQSINSFMFSSDASPIIINYNMGSRELNMDDKFFDTFYFLKDMMNSAAARSTETIDATAMFTRSNSLFALVSTSEIGKLVNSDFNFGILPYPKADLAQVDYMSDYRGGYICVLSSIHDFDLVAASLDALNYYSTGMEDSLWMQALRSEDDIQMMNIVRGGLTCNFARAITASPFTYISDFYSKAITSGINIMAEYKSQELAWKNALHSYNI